MPIKKWIVQYSIALPLVFILLSGCQYLKGRDITYSLKFGLIWTTISITVFAARRVYLFRKHIHCIICNDLPGNKRD
jgi:hypothetical protein